MWLTTIDPKTGLVDISDVQDGVLAVKDFKALIDSKDGLEAFTCVALTMDYLTPHRQYAYKERHIKAMREVTGDSSKFVWGDDLIQNALLAYDRLQFHASLKELELLKEMRLKRIHDIETEKDDDEKQKKFKKLNEIRNLQKDFESSLNMEGILDSAPSINGYRLSRLEQKTDNKNSFYHNGENQK